MRRIAVWSLVTLLAVGAGAAHGGERVRMALLPLVIRSAEGREYLQRGLADMLVSRLARDQRLAVIPVDDPKSATLEAATAREVGVANGAEYVVFGSLTHFGEGASLELLCLSVREEAREPRRIYVHAESMGALLPLLDGVAQRTTYAVLGAPAEGPAVSAGPIPEPAPPTDKPAAIPPRVDETDGLLENREPRAPGLSSDREGEGLR